ncbi:MAG: UDP-N-acetylmuramate:L-alanyl-gamma-D-glutamyl-meso-diaminopimelate ligase, partial [Rhodospirillaceae bacterium]|nr:UDP-N-acetylmuramate:L-alanyl-gamma-D-glutamyl-meso-diaminopimelate ligase [Rhodospirillaceae bacterium]
LAAIETQFHHLVRTVPGNGLIVSNGTDANLDRVLERGLWTPVERFGSTGGWTMGEVDANGHFDVFFNSTLQGRVK